MADVAVPQIVAHVLEGLRKGAVERVLAAFEESSRSVDPRGKSFSKRDGTLASFVSELSHRISPLAMGAADDGRRCFVETAISRDGESEPAAITFERGDSGLLRELRCYYEP
jgi:hypothetical protein